MRADRQSAQKRDPILNPLLLLIPHHDIPWLGVVRRCRILASPLSHIVRVAAGFPSLLLLPLSPFPPSPRTPRISPTHSPHPDFIRHTAGHPIILPPPPPSITPIIGHRTQNTHNSCTRLTPTAPRPRPSRAARLCSIEKEVRGSNPETRPPAYI